MESIIITNARDSKKGVRIFFRRHSPKKWNEFVFIGSRRFPKKDGEKKSSDGFRDSQKNFGVRSEFRLCVEIVFLDDGTAVEHTPRCREVVGSNPAGCWAFSLLPLEVK